jgi:DNA-binding GntR family transcriptional regulator
VSGTALDLDFEPGDFPRTAQQFAYEYVRRAILRGDLPPGTRLTQSDIASRLSLSTTPVREALRRLASEDLVRIDAHRGAIVRGVDKDEPQDPDQGGRRRRGVGEDGMEGYVRWLTVADPGLPVRANQEHRRLLDACRSRDSDEAARIEEEHLLSTFEAMMSDLPELGPRTA